MAHTIQRSTIIITIHTYTHTHEGCLTYKKKMAAGAELHLPEYREEERENERQDGNREMGSGLWAAIRNLCSKKGVIFIGNSFVNVCVLV